MTIYNASTCCGVFELGNITGGGNDVYKVYRQAHSPGNVRRPFVWFADYVRYQLVLPVGSFGRDLRKLIEDNHLGTVYQTEIIRNPNSGNDLEVFVWTVNWTEMDNFCREVRKEIEAKKKKDEELRAELLRQAEEYDARVQSYLPEPPILNPEHGFSRRSIDRYASLEEFNEFRRRPEVAGHSRVEQRRLFGIYLQAQGRLNTTPPVEPSLSPTITYRIPS